MQAMPPKRALSGHAQSFLDFCRVEKGLSANSLSSYLIDLQRFSNGILPLAPDRATAAGSQSLRRIFIWRGALGAIDCAAHDHPSQLL